MRSPRSTSGATCCQPFDGQHCPTSPLIGTFPKPRPVSVSYSNTISRLYIYFIRGFELTTLRYRYIYEERKEIKEV